MYLNNSATQIGHDDDVLEWLARVEKDDASKDNKITVEIERWCSRRRWLAYKFG